MAADDKEITPGMSGALRAFVGWLAGALVGVAATLYGLGFLALQAHLNLLGVARLVQVEDREYLIQGGQLLYHLPGFLAVGCVIWALPSLALYWAVFRRCRPEVQLALLLLFAAALVIGWVAFLAPPTGLLLAQPAGPPGLILRTILTGTKGRSTLMITHAIGCGGLAVLVLAFLLWRAAHRGLTRLTTPGIQLGVIALYALTAICVLLYPVLFGTLVLPLQYPRVTMTVAAAEKTTPELPTVVEGFMLNLSVKSDEPLVLWRVADRKVVVFPKDSWKRMEVVGREALFGEAH